MSRFNFGLTAKWYVYATGLSHTYAHNGGIVQASDDPDSIFADPPTFTLKVTVAPVLFIKPVTVTLDTWTGVDAEAPGAPLWLKQLVDARGVNTPKTFVRLYTWIRFFVQEMFAMPNLTIPHATSWFEIWTLVEHIQVRCVSLSTYVVAHILQRLYATVPRAMSTGPKPKPRPTRVTMRTLVNVFEGLSLADDGEGVGSSMDTSS